MAKAPIYLKPCEFQLGEFQDLKEKKTKRIFKRKSKKIRATEDEDL